MRRATQSMYQPGIANNKSMAVSKMMGTSNLAEGVSGKSVLASKVIKKV
jgi:hypothetical protein